MKDEAVKVSASSFILHPSSFILHLPPWFSLDLSPLVR
jgi:hypothetical protein